MNPDGKFKVTSLNINLSPDLVEYERTTYSLLEWLGDIGGLVDALRYLGGLTVAPIATFSMRASLTSQIFHRVDRHSTQGNHSG